MRTTFQIRFQWNHKLVVSATLTIKYQRIRESNYLNENAFQSNLLSNKIDSIVYWMDGTIDDGMFRIHTCLGFNISHAGSLIFYTNIYL